MGNKVNLDQDDEIVSEINMTPFIDIMLVLLIIFMVSSSVGLETGLDIEVPDTKYSKPTKGETKAVVISLDQSGSTFVDGQQVEESNLTSKIKEALDNKKTKLVIFEGDKTSSLGKTVQIMELAKEAGAENIGIATQSN